jgi:hypothetical protein
VRPLSVSQETGADNRTLLSIHSPDRGQTQRDQRHGRGSTWRAHPHGDCALATSMAISALAPDPAPAAARTRLPRPHALTARVEPLLATRRRPVASHAPLGLAPLRRPSRVRIEIGNRGARARFTSCPCHRPRALAFPASKGLDGRRGVAGLGAGSTHLTTAAADVAAVRPTTACSGSPRVHCRGLPLIVRSLVRPTCERGDTDAVRTRQHRAVAHGNRSAHSGSALGAHVARGGQASQGAERSHTWCLGRASQVGRWLAPPPAVRRGRTLCARPWNRLG